MLITSILAIFLVAAQPTTGGIKGRVKTEDGKSLSGVTIIVYKHDKEVARGNTTAKGEFLISNLVPGVYDLSFQKTGRQHGTLKGVDVLPGKPRTLRDHLILPVDEGSLALVHGLIFSPEGHGIAGAVVELERLGSDGKVVRVDERISNELGEFGFRFDPDNAKYRLRVKAKNALSATKEIDIDGAGIYRIAITLSTNN